MSIFYGLVQMIRGLFMLGFKLVYFFKTRNRLLFYVFEFLLSVYQDLPRENSIFFGFRRDFNNSISTKNK